MRRKGAVVLKAALERYGSGEWEESDTDAAVTREACGALRSVTLGDDRRKDFSGGRFFFFNPRMLRVAISWLEGGFWCCGPRNSVSNPSRGGVGVTACPIRAVGGFAHPVFFWLSFAWSLSRWLSFFWLSLFLFVAFLWLELTGVCQFQYHPVMSPKTWYFISYQVYGIMFY